MGVQPSLQAWTVTDKFRLGSLQGFWRSEWGCLCQWRSLPHLCRQVSTCSTPHSKASETLILLIWWMSLARCWKVDCPMQALAPDVEAQGIAFTLPLPCAVAFKRWGC